MNLKIYLVWSVSLFILTACGGSGGTGNSNNIEQDITLEQNFFYVDSLGECSGRVPCYQTIDDAIRYSFLSQFDENVQAKIQNSQSDQIIVMPGTYYSKDVSEPVIHAGIPADLYNVDKNWKLDIVSEQGPNETVITGNNSNYCIEITDNIEITIKGFTVKNCFHNESSSYNQKHAVFLQSYYHANINIENNIFIDNQSEYATIGISPWVINFEEINIRVTKNIFVNNQVAVVLESFPENPKTTYSADILIDNNIIYENKRGIYLGGWLGAVHNTFIKIINNTVINNEEVGVYVHQTDGVLVKNNIVYGNGIDIKDEYEYDKDNNVTKNIVSEISYLHQLNDNLIDDPLLIDIESGDFTPSLESAAIDAGLTLFDDRIQLDILGNPRVVDGNKDKNESVDIGAIEVQ